MKKEDLVPGLIYKVNSPKFNVAIWTGERFKGPDIVDGRLTFVEAEHFLDGLPLGVVEPTRQLGFLDIKIDKPYDGKNLLVAMMTLSIVMMDYEYTILDLKDELRQLKDTK